MFRRLLKSLKKSLKKHFKIIKQLFKIINKTFQNHAPESWIYETKKIFWWQNNEKLEIRSQCKVLCFVKCFKSCFDTGFRIYVKELCLLVSRTSSKVLYAPSYGRNKFCIEFWSQCRICHGKVILLGEPEANF